MSNISYTPTTWQDLPSTATPINANNLNNIETGISDAVDLVNEIDSNYSQMKLVSYTNITSGADLNNYTTAGSYYCSTSTLAGSLSNCPVSVAFRLDVTTIGVRDSGRYAYVLQEIRAINGIRAFRRYINTSSTANEWTYREWYPTTFFNTNPTGYTAVENDYFTDGASAVYSQGCLAIVKLDGKLIAPTSTWTQIAVVAPAAYSFATNIITNTGTVCRVKVLTDGTLQIHCMDTNVPVVIGTSFVYPISSSI